MTSGLIWSDTIQAEENKQDTNRVIVQVKGQNLKETSKEVLLKKTHISLLYRVNVPKGQSIESYMKELKSQEEVMSVEPDHRISRFYTPNDPDLDLQEHHENIQTKKAWDKTKGNRNIVVAIIDDGIDPYHEDLEENVYGTIGYDDKYPNHVGDIMMMPSFDGRKIKWTEVTSALGKPTVHRKTGKNEWDKMLYAVNDKITLKYNRAGTVEYKPTNKTTFWADYDYDGNVRALGLRYF